MNKLNEEILAKFLMGECTEDELREVNAWLEGSGENARELFRLEEIYHLGRLGDTSNTQDIEKAEKRLFKRLEQEKTKQYKVRRMVGWMRYAAVFVGFFLLGTFGYLFYQTYSQPETLLAVTTHDKIKELKLPDGTKVWLNKNTTLKYPHEFAGKGRKVYLEGEGYFEVTHQEEAPFTVHTSKYDVKVLGTEFNVKAYKDKEQFETSLLKGSVEVSNANKSQTIRLKPDEQVVSDGGQLVRSTIQDKNYFRWKEGLLCLDDESIGSLIEKLELYYDVDIVVQKPSLMKYHYSGKFRIRDGVEHVLKVLQLKHKFTYTKDEELNQIIIK